MSKAIPNHSALKEQIRALENVRNEQEQILLKEIRSTLAAASNPALLIKNIARDLAKDKDFKRDLLKIGLSAGAAYLGRMAQSPAAGALLHSLFVKQGGGGNAGGLLAKVIAFFNKSKSAK